MPAQHITPDRGAEVSWANSIEALMAAWREVVEETSVLVKMVREESESSETEDGGGLRSRIETLAPWESRRMSVASPRPDEPPEMMNVRLLICIALVYVWGYRRRKVERKIVMKCLCEV